MVLLTHRIPCFGRVPTICAYPIIMASRRSWHLTVRTRITLVALVLALAPLLFVSALSLSTLERARSIAVQTASEALREQTESDSRAGSPIKPTSTMRNSTASIIRLKPSSSTDREVSPMRPLHQSASGLRRMVLRRLRYVLTPRRWHLPVSISRSCARRSGRTAW